MASPMRITGMATGLDIDTLVQKLMAAEKMPLDKMVQRRKVLEYQQTDYRTLNSKLLEFRNLAFSMRLKATYGQYSATSSNESVVSASASPGASATSYTFDSITKLAKAANISTADGQRISRDTSVVSGGAISTPIDTNTKNTFKINYNGLGFVDVTLDPGKIYDSGNLDQLVSDIQTKLDSALGAQGIATGTVKATLTNNNTIQFTTNDPLNAAPKSIVLQEGASNDILKAELGFSTDTTTKQISSTVQKIDINQSIYTNLLQDRFLNSSMGTFSWLVNGSDSLTLGASSDTFASSVGFNSTNLGNYNVTALESDSQVSTGVDNITTSINYNANNIRNVSVNINGTKYSVVTGKAQVDLGANEVLASDDGTGKLKLTFKTVVSAGDSINVQSKTTFSAVTGKVQADLAANETLISDDGSGNAVFTFKNQFAAGTTFSAERHDFEFSTTVYNQDGTTSQNTFNINAMTETMASMINKISTNSTAGLSGFYDPGSDKMVLNAKKTGDNNPTGDDFDITLSGGFLTDTLKLTKYSDGEDAAFTLNGLSTTRKENTFTLNGVNLTLKGPTNTPVSVNISQDVNKVYDSIKAFVDKYNETIETFNNKYSEKRFRAFLPLTDEQKAAMKDSDIKAWEDKAKSGLLNGDSLLSGVTSSMRNSFYNPVSGVSDPMFNQLASIGITSSTFYQDRGKLIIDETKLKEALSKSSDKVIELFTKSSTAVDSTQNYNESGIAVRLYNDASNGIKNLTSKAGADNGFSLYDNSIIGKQISDAQKRIDDFQLRLNDKEANYFKRFSALETAINKMNSQSSWLSQQLGGGSQ